MYRRNVLIIRAIYFDDFDGQNIGEKKKEATEWIAFVLRESDELLEVQFSIMIV